jgi:hypothetical protein
MPMIYGISLATAGNTATNGTINTETDVVFVKPGVRNVALQSFYVIGKGAGLTAISGISFRVATFTTASTGGTSITPAPKDPGMEAAKATSASAPAAGSTRTNHLVFGCGAAGPGGWVAPNPDSVILQAGGGAGSTDVFSVSGTVSLNFEFSGEIVE